MGGHFPSLKKGIYQKCGKPHQCWSILTVRSQAFPPSSLLFSITQEVLANAITRHKERRIIIGQRDIKLPFVQNTFSLQEIKENMGTNHQNEKENSFKFSDYTESILKSMVIYIPAISNIKVFQKKMFREATQIIGYIELYVIKMCKTFMEKMIT